MLCASNKQAFELTKNGYRKFFGEDKELIYYGAIVCQALNKWFGLPETPHYLKNAPDKLKKQFAALHTAVASAYNKNPILVELKDRRLMNLKKIVTDRDNYALEYGSLTAQFNSERIEVQLFWDGERKQVAQRIYTDNIDDLLLYDIGKVLELGIVIRQCSVCGRYFVVGKGGRKYCSEHGSKGANKARYNNRQNDRCKYLYCKIYNRLWAAPYDGFDAFKDEYNKLLALESAGEITEDEKYTALQELDKKYRLRRERRR